RETGRALSSGCRRQISGLPFHRPGRQYRPFRVSVPWHHRVLPSTVSMIPLGLERAGSVFVFEKGQVTERDYVGALITFGQDYQGCGDPGVQLLQEGSQVGKRVARRGNVVDDRHAAAVQTVTGGA